MNTRLTTAVSVSIIGCASLAHGQAWRDIFNPLELHTLNLEMDPLDWETIQHDETHKIWVPTMFWLDGEEPILVDIRRKSADPLTAAPGFQKVSFKIDINEYVSGQEWHGLREVGLENGDDQDVVSEGLAWYLHTLASESPVGYGYDVGRASWLRVIINGVDTGVYMHVERRDKRFLQNRGLWAPDETWLYEVEDIHGFELDEGGPGDSPAVLALCYAPFGSPPTCPTPDPQTLAAEVPGIVNMQGLLTMAAVDAVTGNPDAIFSHGKNFYFADYLSGLRLHFPWDLDSAMGGGAIRRDIYETRSPYSQILLAVPEFREQYSRILNDLVCDPFAEDRLHAFLDELEPVLADALAADPNNQLGGATPAEFFAGRKRWFSERLDSVRSQIENFVPCDSCRADLTGDGVLDFFDFLAFQNLFAAGDPRADFTGDGVLDFFDFLAFQNEFASGCP